MLIIFQKSVVVFHHKEIHIFWRLSFSSVVFLFTHIRKWIDRIKEKKYYNLEKKWGQHTHKIQVVIYVSEGKGDFRMMFMKLKVYISKLNYT